MRHSILAAGLILAGAAPALAAPIQFSGRADARAGYGSNPFLRPGFTEASPVLGFSIAPTLRRVTATSQTSLTGSYSREQYSNGLGHPDTLEILLQQVQQFTPDLSMTAQASFSSSTNALNNTAGPDPVTINGQPSQQSVIDPLTVGLRTRRVQGNAAFAWQATDVDAFQLNMGYTRGLSSNNGVSSYSFYNGGLGYTRAVGSRMRIGGRMGYSRTTSADYPTATTYEPGVVLVYQFSEIWAFSGNVGASLRRSPGVGGNSTGLGFDVSFCGTYPVTSVCITGGRLTSASGFGGARINTSFGMRASHKLNARDSASFEVAYVNSDSIGGLFQFGQQFTQVSGNFDHKLGPRWVVGVDGRFQSRAQDRVSGARALNATLHLSYLFGRVG